MKVKCRAILMKKGNNQVLTLQYATTQKLQLTTMSTYKLTYFNAKGRAEVCRMLFHLGGVEFEDERLAGEEFGALKASGALPFGAVPALTVDGQVFAQSQAMERFLAREFNLYGNNNLDALRIDNVMEGVVDLHGAIMGKLWGLQGEERAATAQKLMEENWDRYVQGIEKLVVGPWVCGETFSVADVTLVNLVDHTEPLGGVFGPKVQAIIDAGKEKLADYLANRPVTPF
eukprot:TRINITY_DN494_c0_g1_i1.p1 TRINITY_DN494_c0_g1~~TRINITY_DN494_c0_g1_i1.p1  ORF type:complete len:230 (+),score=71.79 TRINITY_DN494_c0_g1_i1:50-739(+)